MKMVGKSCKISSTSFVTTIFPVRVPPLYGYHHCAIAKKKAANDSLFSCQGDKSRTKDSSFFFTRYSECSGLAAKEKWLDQKPVLARRRQQSKGQWVGHLSIIWHQRDEGILGAGIGQIADEQPRTGIDCEKICMIWKAVHAKWADTPGEAHSWLVLCTNANMNWTQMICSFKKNPSKWHLNKWNGIKIWSGALRLEAQNTLTVRVQEQVPL